MLARLRSYAIRGHSFFFFLRAEARIRINRVSRIVAVGFVRFPTVDRSRRR